MVDEDPFILNGQYHGCFDLGMQGASASAATVLAMFSWE